MVWLVIWLLGLMSWSAGALFSSPSYEPACDTNRRERDALRDAVTNRLRETNEFNQFVASTTMLPIITADTQGAVYAYSAPLFQGIGPIYQLRQSTDAILYLYCNPAPPGLVYWSTTQFLVRQSLSVWLRRSGATSEMGDSINQLRMNSTAKVNANNATDTLPWGKTSAIITTSDIDSASAITDALVAVGFPVEAINIQVIPSNLTDISFGSPSFTASLFATGFRDRTWLDPSEAQRYNRYREPVVFYSDNTRVPNPFPTPPLLPRGGFQNETYLQPSFDALLAAVKEHYQNQVGLTLLNETIFDPYRPENGCIEQYIPDRCGFGTEDFAYNWVELPVQPWWEGMNVIVGVAHVKTGMALYSTMGLSIAENKDTSELVGSVEALLGPTAASSIVGSEFFYVLEVRRNCFLSAPGVPCIQYPIYFPFVLPVFRQQGFAGTFLERTGLQPETKTAPALDEIITPVWLRYKSPSWF